MSKLSIKQEFNVQLLPIIDLLDFKQGKLPPSEWMVFVNKTKQSILNTPTQFLGGQLPDADTISETIIQIFDEYLERKGMLV